MPKHEYTKNRGDLEKRLPFASVTNKHFANDSFLIISLFCAQKRANIEFMNV